MKSLFSLILACAFSLKAEMALPKPDFAQASSLLAELGQKKGPQKGLKSALPNFSLPILSSHGNYLPNSILSVAQKNDPKQGQDRNLLHLYKEDGPILSEYYPKEENKCHTCRVSSNQDISKLLSDSSSSQGLQLIVFVSFSLGDATLKQLYHDVARIGGQLVLRGFYKNSFKETQKKIKELEINVEIDPPLFEQFQITQVPTFVLSSSVDREKPGPYDVIHGNVSVQFALETFASEGSMPGASLLLQLLKGGKE